MPDALKPRLLFLSHRVPFPPHSGAAIRTYHVLRELSQTFDIHALCFHRDDPATASVPLDARISALAPFARCEAFPIPQQQSRLRLVLDHARSLATGRPYTWYVHDDARFLKRIETLLSDWRPSLVHVDSLDLVRALPMLPAGRTVLTHHNIESELLARRGSSERNGVRGRYLRLQAAAIERAERRWTPCVALNLCASPDDVTLLAARAPTARSVVIPNGVDDAYFRPDGTPRDGGLVFVGGTSWYPNKDALTWCVDEVLPRLRADGIDLPVTWVGRVSDAERRSLAGVTGLVLTGYVDDVRPYLARAHAFIAPIRVGGGTRLKILDAWAMGTPLIGTAAAMEGLTAIDGEDHLAAETPEAFSRAVRRLLSEPALASRVGAGGRRAVEARFGWSRIGAELRGHYAEAVARSA